MTSNVGAREIAQDSSVGFGTTGEAGLTADEIRGRAMGELKRLFRPEFINRVDDIVVFQKLAGESLTHIAELLVDDLRQRLIANGMNIVVTDAALEKIVREGTDLTMALVRCAVPSSASLRIRCPRSCWRANGPRAIRSSATLSTVSSCSPMLPAKSPLLARSVSSVRVLTPRRRAAPRAPRAPQAPPVGLSNRAPARTEPSARTESCEIASLERPVG